MKRALLSTSVFGLIVASLCMPTHALPRSAAAKAEFKRANPCPATGQRRGTCPGWQIDHRHPLKCGGADHPSNMQWLTVEAHKAKTRREAQWCRKPR